ncbi:hypothetical protein FOA43_001425 [Brettanomyces nanus]|uniref:Enoyl reductase (ER) domain-containing protein n=1 Tax=Eeniella nana TaxID=13502 RepID=A0A875RZL4_EENNA|nr:uncharacterized protein FOA43_001425 [Brettanomyces nanus]QPG74103.1 hypothetical protein FOA43_001425 [Brettanomyces nanus]
MSETIKEIKSIGVHDFDNWLEPKNFVYTPNPLRPFDIDIKIIACGICGSDTHCAKGDWGRPYTPIAVGHEIIGHIINMGNEVDKTKYHLGDRVGVGAQCDSCGKCWRCDHDVENSCKTQVGTYGTVRPDGSHSQGGYSNYVRVNKRFVFKIPDAIETIHAAPLLCGGMTGLRPLMTAGVTKGTKVGVSGIGGIGHMTILFAKALGAEVTAISRTESKKETALKLGADHFIATSDPKFPEEYLDSFDLIVTTAFSLNDDYVEKAMRMLRPHCKLHFISAPPTGEKLELDPNFLLSNSLSIGSSAAGSQRDVEYMLQFAADKGIKPWVETIDISEENIAKAWKRMKKGDVHFRFVLTGYDKYFSQH